MHIYIHISKTCGHTCCLYGSNLIYTSNLINWYTQLPQMDTKLLEKDSVREEVGFKSE